VVLLKEEEETCSRKILEWKDPIHIPKGIPQVGTLAPATIIQKLY
jgi:hypothetical protein